MPPKLTKTEKEENKKFLYSTAVTPLSENQKSNIKVKPLNPLTRVKPLLPNILDQAAIDQVLKRGAIRRESGRKWTPVQEL